MQRWLFLSSCPPHLRNGLVLLSSIVKLLVFAWIKVASVPLLFTKGWKHDFYKCVRASSSGWAFKESNSCIFQLRTWAQEATRTTSIKYSKVESDSANLEEKRFLTSVTCAQVDAYFILLFKCSRCSNYFWIQPHPQNEQQPEIFRAQRRGIVSSWPLYTSMSLWFYFWSLKYYKVRTS